MKSLTLLLLFTSTLFTHADTVKVFILAGQSNMEGAGKIAIDKNARNEGKGTLEYLVKHADNKADYAHLVDANGDWITRDDVFIAYLDRKGPLTVGYGARASAIGPELQFGHVVGDAYDEPVLIIKTAWGGKSLAKDFRPPSAGRETGAFYKEMLHIAQGLIADPGATFPELAGKQVELAGFGWHQGWNDGCSLKDCQEYETNLAHFIRDIRKALNAPTLPFVIADSGFGGRNQKVDRRLMIRKAQAAPAHYDEFKGTVASIETQDFFRSPEESPSRQGYHWNSNAETYFLIGNALGQEVVRLNQ